MKQCFRISILFIYTLIASCDEEHAPISLHKENPHYFMFRGKPTVLITSGEHYGALLNLDFDYITYLDELQAKGFNCTRLFTGPYVEFSGWYEYRVDQPLSPAPGRFICPWARSSESGYINGGNKFDLSKWDNEYFKRLHDIFTQASQRGVVVELTLFCPYYDDLLWDYSPLYWTNNINNVGNISRTNVLTMDNGNLMDVQEAYVRKIVDELKSYDNLIYEICNEPYVENLATNDWMHHISQIIKDAESDLEYRHLQSQNVINDTAKIKDPLANVSVFNFHYGTPEMIALNYDLNKVLGNNETGSFEPNIAARTNAWRFIIGGGGLFNNLDLSFSTSDATGGMPDGEGAILRSQLSMLKKFIERFDFVRMKPDSITSTSGTMEGVSINVLSEPGVAYAIYVSMSDLKDTKLKSGEFGFKLPSGNYKAMWLNPVTGKVDKEESFTHSGGEKKLDSPAFNPDVALEIIRTEDD